MSVLLYGLAVEADFDLGDAGPRSDAPADVRVTTGSAFTDWQPQPPGETMLDFATHEPWYTLVRLHDGSYHYRVHRIGDFLISADARDVEMHLHSDVAPGMDAIMVTGTVLSLLLFLRGTSVFHGSAVAAAAGAVGFVGHSGQGKTTMATLFCAEGAAAVTDDVLVVDLDAGRPAVRRGSRELRLRSGMADLAAQVPGAATRTSADARQILAPTHSGDESLPLRAVLIPLPTRDGSALRFERLRGATAAFALIRYPRLMGWQDPAVLQRMFVDATRIAAQVPILVVHVPWGPPFPHDLTGSLNEALHGDG